MLRIVPIGTATQMGVGACGGRWLLSLKIAVSQRGHWRDPETVWFCGLDGRYGCACRNVGGKPDDRPEQYLWHARRSDRDANRRNGPGWPTFQYRRIF